MRITAAILLEDGNRLIPFCRTRRASVVRRVAATVLADVIEARDRCDDDNMRVLLDQERARLTGGFEQMGLGAVDD